MFKILDEVCTPKRGTKYSAYVDLFAREDITIGAGETKIVKLGVKIDTDFFLYEIGKVNVTAGGIIESDDDCSKAINDFLKSHYLEIALRSSLGVKGLIISNGIGIIDLDYPDEIGLIVHNPISEIESFNDGCSDFIELKGCNEQYHFVIKKGDKVAQCTLKEHKGYLMGYETETLRTGGFGSTDNKEEAPNFDKPDFFKCTE